MNIVQARQFVMGVVGLSSNEQNHLKQLLNKGVIVPVAVIDSTVDDLREIISLNPQLSTERSMMASQLTRADLENQRENGPYLDADWKCRVPGCGKMVDEHPAAPAPAPASSTSGFRASFHWRKKTKSIEFHDYDTMLSQLHQHWPFLKTKHNLVLYHTNIKNISIVDDKSLRAMFGKLGNISNIHFYVDTKSQDFSWYSKHHDTALSSVHSSELLMSVELFALDERIAEEKYDTAVDVFCSELFDRIRVLDLEQSTEYTMRELISPVLVRALCLVDDFHGHANKTKVRLICEKLVSGSSGHGPIDYVMSYLNVLIVIGEAKHEDLLDGFYQNLVQQYNALESLAHKIVGSSTVGSKRSHDFVQVMSSLQNLGTYGITSTGKEWIFSRTEPDPRNASRVKIVKSPIHALLVSPSASPVEILAIKEQVRVLLRIIVGMIFNQKTAVDKHETLKNQEIQTKINAQECYSRLIATDASDESDDEDD